MDTSRPTPPPISILLVEDNVDDVEIVRRLFRRLAGSFRVEIAYTAAEAQARVVAANFDLALVDQQLPDARGEQLISVLLTKAPHLPIVMLTGQGDERLAVEVMKAGAYDYVRKDDLDRATLRRMVHNVLERSRLQAEIREAQERLREWAIRDGLTGLFNHRHFQSLLRREGERARRYGQPLACLMLDLDHFKSINDTFGHPFGDEVLKHVAATLVEATREVDVVGRYGGEEFVIVLPNTDAAGAVHVAQRICRSVAERPVEFDGNTVWLTVSIGVATTADPEVCDEQSLIKRADVALYQAKNGGRNQVQFADRDGLVTSLTPPHEGSPTNRLALGAAIRALKAVADARAAHVRRVAHSHQVARVAERFARALALDEAQREALSVAARLHELGHMVLTPDEVRAVAQGAPPLGARQHPAIAADMMLRAGLPATMADAVRHHQEWWDGNGYPGGLTGPEVPQLARILTIVDGFVELAGDQGLTPHDALLRMAKSSGTRFDPDHLGAFSVFVEDSPLDDLLDDAP